MLALLQGQPHYLRRVSGYKSAFSKPLHPTRRVRYNVTVISRHVNVEMPPGRKYDIRVFQPPLLISSTLNIMEKDNLLCKERDGPFSATTVNLHDACNMNFNTQNKE
jgi:hypothetical protein